jgi:molybdopterin/thiamine biosynthesis adenylyltransferase
MTINAPPTGVAAIAAVDAWFEGVGRTFLGKLLPDDPLLAGKGAAGWRISTKGYEILVVVDADFPFSRPKCYLNNVTSALPHVEHNGKLCLRNPEIPSDPASAVASAIGLARQLLTDISIGAEDDDFQEDFGLYWSQTCDGSAARLLGLQGAESAHGRWIATSAAFYGFRTAIDADRWWQHRFGRTTTKLRRMATIRLNVLPSPGNYPATLADLWNLVNRRSVNGLAVLQACLEPCPKALLVTLTGNAPSGRSHAVSLLLSRKPDQKGKPLKRRAILGPGRKLPFSVERLSECFDLKRLQTQSLDAAGTRLPYAERDQLARSRVAIIGCGALGSGVARHLAKSGVGHLMLVDPETLGWENIRRHQLGAGHVGLNKAKGLAMAIAQENPDILAVEAYDMSIQTLLSANPNALTNVDLILACTANWAANSLIDDRMQAQGEPPCIYAWMEAHALASHAVLIMPGDAFRSGYDAAGNPPMAASSSSKPAPEECGGLTTPFGAIELAHAETITARFAMDYLRGRTRKTEWRTWLTDTASLADADGEWTKEWITSRGQPNPLGEIVTADWK